MNIWGTILFSIKIIFPVCVIRVCVVQGQLYVCVCLSALPRRPERCQVFSLSMALCLTFCLWPGLSLDQKSGFAAWFAGRAPLGPAFPPVLESLGCSATLSLLHGRWDLNSGPLAFRVLFPHKAKSLTPRFLL